MTWPVLFLLSLQLLLASGFKLLDMGPCEFDAVVMTSWGVHLKPTLIMFYTPNCILCKKLESELEEVHQRLPAYTEVNVAKVDIGKHRELGTKFQIETVPSLKLFTEHISEYRKKSNPAIYPGSNDAKSILKYVNYAVNSRHVKGPVEILTNENFHERTGTDKHVIVAITCPWNGHCGALNEQWEALASDFAAEQDIIVARLPGYDNEDKPVAVVKEFGINGYHDVFFYPKGSSEPEYCRNDKTKQDFVDFLNERTGTKRQVGGRLNTEAGTIETLNLIVTKLNSRNTLEVIMKAKKAVEISEEPYAYYYIEVLEKLMDDRDYANKEYQRLEAFLKKKQKSQSEEDDAVCRLNILRQFAPDEHPIKVEL